MQNSCSDLLWDLFQPKDILGERDAGGGWRLSGDKNTGSCQRAPPPSPFGTWRGYDKNFYSYSMVEYFTTTTNLNDSDFWMNSTTVLRCFVKYHKCTVLIYWLWRNNNRIFGIFFCHSVLGNCRLVVIVAESPVLIEHVFGSFFFRFLVFFFCVFVFKAKGFSCLLSHKDLAEHKIGRICRLSSSSADTHIESQNDRAKFDFSWSRAGVWH